MKIGIFGLSGSGKSFLVEQFISDNKNFISTKASQLIAQASKNIQFDKLTTKSIDDNQLALIEGFNFFCAENHNTDILIELHNIIEKSNGVAEIDDSVLQALNLDAACYLFISPEKIYNQRMNDKKRARAKTPIDKLNKLQEKSLSKFKDTFNYQRVPFIVLTKNYLINLSSFISKLGVTH